MANSSYLSTQLMAFAPYLRDAGWRETATLLIAAAAEIEELKQRVAELEISEAARGWEARLEARNEVVCKFDVMQDIAKGGVGRPRRHRSRRPSPRGEHKV